MLLAFPAEEVVRGLDAGHRHTSAPRPPRRTRRGVLPRDAGLLPTDEQALRGLGSVARPVADALTWGGLTITRTPARHGSGHIAEPLAPVSGFVLDDLYLAGDTVWYEAVELTIERHRPRVAVVNAGGAEFVEGGPVVMGADDVREVVELSRSSSRCTWKR